MIPSFLLSESDQGNWIVQNQNRAGPHTLHNNTPHNNKEIGGAKSTCPTPSFPTPLPSTPPAYSMAPWADNGLLGAIGYPRPHSLQPHTLLFPPRQRVIRTIVSGPELSPYRPINTQPASACIIPTPAFLCVSLRNTVLRWSCVTWSKVLPQLGVMRWYIIAIAAITLHISKSQETQCYIEHEKYNTAVKGCKTVLRSDWLYCTDYLHLPIV